MPARSFIVAQHDKVVASYSWPIGSGTVVGADAGAAGADLRSGGALPAGSRQLDRIAHSERGIAAAKPSMRFSRCDSSGRIAI